MRGASRTASLILLSFLLILPFLLFLQMPSAANPGDGVRDLSASHVFYGYASDMDGAYGGYVNRWLHVVGLEDNTTVYLYNIMELPPSLVATATINRMVVQRWSGKDQVPIFFKIMADKPVVATVFVGQDIPTRSYATFYPTVDGSFVGRDFIFEAYRGTSTDSGWGGAFDASIFACEAATVYIYDATDTLLSTFSLLANKTKKYNFATLTVYHVNSTGNIMIRQSPMEDMTLSASTSGNFVGKTHYGSCPTNWGIWAIAYEPGTIKVYKISVTPVQLIASHTFSKAGEFWKVTGSITGGFDFLTMSTGNVSVGSGYMASWGCLGYLGYIGGKYNATVAEYWVWGSKTWPDPLDTIGEIVIFAHDNTEFTVNGIAYTLGADEHLVIHPPRYEDGGAIYHIASNRPLTINDLHGGSHWGSYLSNPSSVIMPPPPLSPPKAVINENATTCYVNDTLHIWSTSRDASNGTHIIPINREDWNITDSHSVKVFSASLGRRSSIYWSPTHADNYTVLLEVWCEEPVPTLPTGYNYDNATARKTVSERPKYHDVAVLDIQMKPPGYSLPITLGGILKKEIEGNYEIYLTVVDTGASDGLKVFFSSNEDLSRRVYLEVAGDSFKIVREMSGQIDVWKERQGVGSLPWTIRVLKKGNFFRFWVNGVTEWIRGPLGEWEGIIEPWKAYVGIEAAKDAEISSFTVTTLPLLSEHNEPVIPRGPEGSFYEQQAIPGGIIEFQGKYYMYFMAGMVGEEEGSANRTVGVASSEDLIHWTVYPEPVFDSGDVNFPCDNIYPSGAVVTPEGKIAVMYAAQKFPEWQGFGLATADNPFGPFTQHPNNPVYKYPYPHHEFDLVRVDSPDYRYILFFAGFTPNPERGPAGDRGYVIYSDDLVNWREDPRNPVFYPETLDNWDAVHVRPRSLSKIGDTWYLWYEGCNNWVPPNMPSHHGWWDSVGLACSKDLVNWEYYPRNPTLPGLGTASDWDWGWVGWPRMFIKDNIGYVFYTGNAEVGLRRISIDQLTNWESEGGTTIDMLAPLQAYTSWLQPITIEVTVKNQGTFTETFAVTAYTDTTPVGPSQTITLAPGATKTLTYAWAIPTTVTYPYPTYTLSANATLPDDIDQQDNALTDGTITVRWPGDATGDGKVNIYDLTELALSWRKPKTHPAYNPLCDFTGDGEVNIFDLTKLAKNWRKGPVPG